MKLPPNFEVCLASVVNDQEQWDLSICGMVIDEYFSSRERASKVAWEIYGSMRLSVSQENVQCSDA